MFVNVCGQGQSFHYSSVLLETVKERLTGSRCTVHSSCRVSPPSARHQVPDSSAATISTCVRLVFVHVGEGVANEVGLEVSVCLHLQDFFSNSLEVATHAH